jgi:hypothetical protein
MMSLSSNKRSSNEDSEFSWNKELHFKPHLDEFKSSEDCTCLVTIRRAQQ